MRTKEDFIKRLNESEQFKLAMKSARSDDERASVAALASEIALAFAEILGPIAARVQEDSAFADQLGRALIDGRSVLTNASGSAG